MDWAGLIALGISLYLAWLEIRRTFFLKPQISAKVDWNYRETVLEGLSFYVANTGTKKTVVAEAGIRCSDDEGPEYFRGNKDVMDRLPIVLDVDEATPRLFFPIRKYMRDGLVTGIVVIDHKRKIHEFPVPKMAPPDDYIFRRD